MSVGQYSQWDTRAMAIREGVVDSPLVLEHNFVWTSPHDSFHVGRDCARWLT